MICVDCRIWRLEVELARMFVLPLTVRFLPEFDVWFAFRHGLEQGNTDIRSDHNRRTTLWLAHSQWLPGLAHSPDHEASVRKVSGLLL
jgi:hypothetical protein